MIQDINISVTDDNFLTNLTSFSNANESITASTTSGVLSGNKIKYNWINKLKILPLSLISGGLLLGSIGSYIFYSSGSNQVKQTIQYIESLKSNTDSLEKNSLAIRSTQFSSFDTLNSTATKLEALLTVLQNGGRISSNDTVINPIDSVLLTSLKGISDKWANNKIIITSLVKRKEELSNLKNALSKAETQAPIILEQSISLQREINKTGNPKAIKMANELVFLSQRSANSLSDVIYHASFPLEDGYALIKDLVFINAISNIFTDGSSIYEIEPASAPHVITALKQFKDSLGSYNELSDSLKTGVVLLNNSKELSSSLYMASIEIKNTISELTNTYTSSLKNLNIYQYLSFSLFLLFILNILLISLVSFQRSKKYENLAKEFKKNQNNAQVADNLLDQLKPLDEGDFSRPIFVEDKFLMNIANRIDTTRILFGEIVKQMKDSSSNILHAAESTGNTSQELLDISHKQFLQLDETINSISEITNSMDEIAQTAWIAQDESTKSSEEAQKGENLVNQSISKMNEIRNTIQESSKKIKKLGESAQSISEVTSLIKDITKQINILALNAAIQAASSGESGREFTIVAQEVQRLADDSENATKKIEELINDIQSDTAIAISSMEKTTQEVVLGSKLTELAGVALKEITQLSKSTADNISIASTKLEDKSSEMATITINMQDLQKTSQSSQNAVNVTTSQVEALKKISETLEHTFNKFKV